MKQFRHLIAVAVAAALVLGAHAGAVDSAMARAAAEAWAAANPAFGAGGTALSAEADYEGGVLMWWTVRLSGGGAAFVAPETSLEPVLAAVPSYGGALPAAHPLRSILAADVANRRAKIAEATAVPVSNSGLVARGASASAITNAAIAAAVTAAEGKWAKFASGRSSLKPRALAPTANITVVDGFGDESANRWMRFWDQSSFNWDGEFVELCFNLYTPSNSVCGCVATAGAALLQWFGCTGLLHNVMRECTYDGVPVKLTTMSGTNPYDWASLPPSMGGSGTEGVSDSVIETLGRAAYDVGVCVKMM